MLWVVEVVPTDCGLKLSNPGKMLAVVVGGGGGCQIPLRDTTAPWPENRSVTRILPYELLPSAGAVFAGVGANATEIGQGVVEQEPPWVTKNGRNCPSTTWTLTGSLLKLVTVNDCGVLTVPNGV